MRSPTLRIAALALSMALATAPLAACGGSSSQADTSAASSSAAVSQPAKVDTSTWTTLGDALAGIEGQDIGYSYNDKYFVCVFTANGARIRAVAKMDMALEGKFADLDMGAEDYAQKFAEVVSGLKLVSAEDISGDQLSQNELDALIGKTGQELVDDGFVFESYSRYGGEQTGANMGKGYFAYDMTFDTHVDESQTEDEGAAVMGAKVTAVDSFGNLSNAALDPELVD